MMTNTQYLAWWEFMETVIKLDWEYPECGWLKWVNGCHCDWVMKTGDSCEHGPPKVGVVRKGVPYEIKK